ncbi:alpha-1,3-mannosyl-glycoprotein 2-beta-N-acetylglucosaminyltransferase isoform X3 [Lathyrus oleraceus]|uniref:alpha-1,3-mannosyl-glycoprotein 2-beta-N-acetylglucosaminyltransferase isoform X3 n=1 Tax=Pisum sativum TaxID=3888 RepID=UPI0021CF7244|nr:alpha-1,3-mannosyl-glycoprotein 2-beta-N-acetylglucosaminyltransferase isoform X3 [Pisum sativum]
MAKFFCDFRLLLFVAAVVFIYIQMRLFATQSQYADRLAASIQAENHCTSQMQSLIDQISLQQGRIVSLQGKEVRRLIDKVQVPVAAVVIMACNRADYLERTINSVLKYQRAISSRFPLFVSQDGSNSNVKNKALSYDELSYMQHLDFESVQTERPGELIAYYKISRHYKWALGQLFYKHNFSRVIILEDDMEIAPDFFDYFEAMATLLDKDKSIMAVSSWNDNGQKQFVHDPYELYRSDFFPGLGWMLARSTWDELSPKWPKAYWDDWLRLKENHKGRQFIRPEVCRTYNFGEHGSSLGQFFKQYLEPIRLNEVQVNWKSMDLSYLLEDKYNIHLANNIKKAKPVSGADIVQKTHNIDGDVRIKYNDQWDFENIAQQFGVFQEWKDGVPRTAYKGVVVFRYQTTRRVFLIGPESLKLLEIEYLDS